MGWRFGVIVALATMLACKNTTGSEDGAGLEPDASAATPDGSASFPEGGTSSLDGPVGAADAGTERDADTEADANVGGTNADGANAACPTGSLDLGNGRCQPCAVLVDGAVKLSIPAFPVTLAVRSNGRLLSSARITLQGQHVTPVDTQPPGTYLVPPGTYDVIYMHPASDPSAPANEWHTLETLEVSGPVTRTYNLSSVPLTVNFATDDLDGPRLAYLRDDTGGLVYLPRTGTAQTSVLPGHYELVADGPWPNRTNPALASFTVPEGSTTFTTDLAVSADQLTFAVTIDGQPYKSFNTTDANFFLAPAGTAGPFYVLRPNKSSFTSRVPPGKYDVFYRPAGVTLEGPGRAGPYPDNLSAIVARNVDSKSIGTVAIDLRTAIVKITLPVKPEKGNLALVGDRSLGAVRLPDLRLSGTPTVRALLGTYNVVYSTQSQGPGGVNIGDDVVAHVQLTGDAEVPVDLRPVPVTISLLDNGGPAPDQAKIFAGPSELARDDFEPWSIASAAGSKLMASFLSGPTTVWYSPGLPKTYGYLRALTFDAQVGGAAVVERDLRLFDVALTLEMGGSLFLTTASVRGENFYGANGVRNDGTRRFRLPTGTFVVRANTGARPTQIPFGCFVVPPL